MPDFSLPKTSIKPYQNRPRGVMNALLLPTLKPEEPFYFVGIFFKRNAQRLGTIELGPVG